MSAKRKNTLQVSRKDTDPGKRETRRIRTRGIKTHASGRRGKSGPITLTARAAGRTGKKAGWRL